MSSFPGNLMAKMIIAPSSSNAPVYMNVGTALLVPGRTTLTPLYFLEPDEPIHVEIVKGLLFGESELKELPS